MIIIKSSIKNNKINQRNNLQNRNYKNFIKIRIKNYLNSLNNFKIVKTLENQKKLESILNLVYSSIDKAVKKKIIHKNKALRNKIKLKKNFIEITSFKS